MPLSERLARAVAEQRLHADPAQQEAAARLDALASRLTTGASPTLRRLRSRLPRWIRDAVPLPPRGLYLWGGVGRGKTLLMDWFVESLPHPARGLVERHHFYRFMREVHGDLAGRKPRSAPLDGVAERLAARMQVLCLDEFLVADIGDAMILAGLLDGLFRRGIALVATSNLPPAELYRDGLQRARFEPAIRLIESHVDVVPLDGGPDYRLRALARAPTYLDSGDAATGALLAARFAAVAGGGAGGPTELTIEGRRIQASNSSHGMASFDFAALCSGPRSQNDYIALARLFHTVFIADVPILADGDDDAARRFIMLVDEFYDRAVKVVISAAAPPHALYRGERLRFEFARAASRLIEMQSEAYFARPHRP